MVVLHILTFTVQIPSTCRPIFFFCFFIFKYSTKVVVGRDSWYLQTVPMDWVGVECFPKYLVFLRISFSGVAATATTLDLWKNASQDVKELDYSEYLILCWQVSDRRNKRSANIPHICHLFPGHILRSEILHWKVHRFATNIAHCWKYNVMPILYRAINVLKCKWNWNTFVVPSDKYMGQ